MAALVSPAVLGVSAQMGAGAAMLITVGVVLAALLLLDRWQKRRTARRRAAQADEGGGESAADEAKSRSSLWAFLFGPPAGEEPPYDPMHDMHPDELEGNYDGDPPRPGPG